MMYSTDIIDLFSEFKNIAYGFTNDIFNSKKNNESSSLLEFIYNNIELLEDYNEDNDDIEEDYDVNDYY